MNWILVCVFNLLLFNSCLTTYIDRSLSPDYTIQQNKSGNGAPANDELFYPIFDLAEFEQILQMAKKPETADFVINHIFPVKYPNYTFALQIKNGEVITEQWDIIYFHNFDLYLDVITHFGKHMKKITMFFSGNMNEEDSAVLFGHINEHCSDSLSELLLPEIKENTFKYFTKPFLKMKSITFYIKSDQIGSNLSLDVIFPTLEFLRIGYYENQNNIQNNGSRFIDSELPVMKHLKTLNTYIAVNNQTILAAIQKQLRDMIQKNPQIQQIFCGLLDDFQDISEYLPNLNYLSFNNLGPEIRPVHFENVKHLNAWLYARPYPVERISFSRLETLDCCHERDGSNGSLRNSWMQFFRNHQSLKQLNCDAIEEDGLVEFLAELPNVHGIRIHSYRTFNLDLINQLIDSPQNWVKFHYDANPRDESFHMDVDGFIEKFQNDWNITYSFEGRQFIELERRI